MSGKGKGEGKGKGYPALSVVKANSNHANQNPSLSRPPVPASQTFKMPGQGRSPSPTGQGRSPSPTGKKGHLQKNAKPVETPAGGLIGMIGSWFEEADPKLTPKPESGSARTGASSPEKKRSLSPPRAQSRPLPPKPLPGEQRRVTDKKPPPKTTGGFDFGCCTSRPKDMDEQDYSESPSRISSHTYIGASPTSKSVMQANRESQNPSLSPPPVKGASLTSKSAMQANRASQNPSLSPPPVQGHRSSQTLKKATSPRKASPPPRVSKGPASQLPQSPSTISNPNKEPLRPFADRLQEPWSPSKVRSPQGTPPQKTLVPSTSTISVHGVDHHRARLEGA